jgi:hypothetical protein
MNRHYRRDEYRDPDAQPWWHSAIVIGFWLAVFFAMTWVGPR